jgi:hypothetical protein
MKHFVYLVIKALIVAMLSLFIIGFSNPTRGQIIIFDCFALIGIDFCVWIKSKLA